MKFCNDITQHLLPVLFALLFTACSPEQKSKSEQSCLSEIPALVKLGAAQALIGSDTAYPEERPARSVQVKAFDMDATEVTNRQFATFVKATDYITDAEKPQPGFGMPGAAVFMPPTTAHPSWWQFVKDANWRHPEGSDSTINGKDNDPVVQVSQNDARLYAKWRGRRLPTEQEWEYAARAGADTLYIWGKDLVPDGLHRANTWQGAFPIENTGEDGFVRRAPVGCYAPNTFGLYDMIGNVWEWTETVYQHGNGEQVYIIKGGSFLCAPNYCRRYRASARQPQEAGLPTNHIGFRTVKTLD